jgi:hypothetical protein
MDTIVGKDEHVQVMARFEKHNRIREGERQSETDPDSVHHATDGTA